MAPKAILNLKLKKFDLLETDCVVAGNEPRTTLGHKPTALLARLPARPKKTEDANYRLDS